MDFAPKLGGWLEAAGLEAVEQRFVDCPAGARNARADLVAKSINGICDAIDPLIPVANSNTSFPLFDVKGNADGILALPTSFKPESCPAWVSAFIMSWLRSRCDANDSRLWTETCRLVMECWK